jgi:hypothetical protein
MNQTGKSELAVQFAKANKLSPICGMVFPVQNSPIIDNATVMRKKRAKNSLIILREYVAILVC